MRESTITPQPDPSPAGVPSWLISCLLHAVLVVLLGWMLHTAPRGVAPEPGREVGIVLKRITDEGLQFDTEADQPSESVPQATDAAVPDVAAVVEAANDFDPNEFLPKQPILGAGDLPAGGATGAGDFTQGVRQPRTIQGGKARVKIYNLEGEGRKFIFVFDRSVSMAGAPLASAKEQLIAGLESLEPTHPFQIIFFNHTVRVFDLSGGQNRLPLANPRTKMLAANFVGGITADGGTDRYAALMMAVSMRPDVIFFLTDVDDPMSALEVERIRRRNKQQSIINAIQFGSGPFSGDTNFLIQLAHQSGGGWVYVDTLRLAR